MSDLFTIPPSSAAATQAQAPSNVPVQSVSDVAQGVKRTVEAAFGRVRIRGEVSRPNYHRSGHLYPTLKDDRAVIDAVSWKGQVSKLGFRVEEGMEVIATGKLTTYPGGSKNIKSSSTAWKLPAKAPCLKCLRTGGKSWLPKGCLPTSARNPSLTSEQHWGGDQPDRRCNPRYSTSTG